jgi:hypothetical protein
MLAFGRLLDRERLRGELFYKKFENHLTKNIGLSAIRGSIKDERDKILPIFK